MEDQDGQYWIDDNGRMCRCKEDEEVPEYPADVDR